jgi:ribonuclease P protein component
VACASFVLLCGARPPSGAAGASTNASLPARLGLVASRRVGPAVARNRAKRLVREWFRHRARELPDGIDLVVILRARAASLGLGQVQAELDRALPELRRQAARLAERVPGPA